MTKESRGGGPNDMARLQQSPRHVQSWQQAQQNLLQGRPASALTAYRSLVKQFPGAAQLWAELALAAAGDLDFALADQATGRAAELAVGDANLLVSIGQQYHRFRRLDEATRCFEAAVAADPASPHARLSLAAWHERNRRLNEAWDCVDQCLALHPRDARALYYRAFLLHREGRNGDAETALRDLLKSDLGDADARFSATHLLGAVLDAVGNYGEAMQKLGEAKTMLRRMNDITGLERVYDAMAQARRDLLAGLTAEHLRRWREEAAPESPGPRLAFLGGPPRSGTTLIEQILGAHPQILVFDEAEAFAQEVLNPISPPPPARGLTLKNLNGLPADDRRRWISRYFKSLQHEVRDEASGRLLVDKNPALTASLHLWLRLLPRLKVIITLRDPRDVVISCYFQNLTLTAANANFLSLERAARFYADCMDVWLRLRDLGGFDWIETRYEDVVSRLEEEGRRLTAFLELPWDAAQAAFHESARRKFVFAPTYSDVAKPVHAGAVGRWQHYAKALAPIQRRLEPYIKAFHYHS